MKKVFFDTNLMLDSALERGENGVAATAILSACEYGEIEGCLSFLSVANMAYTLKKGRTKQGMMDILKGYTFTSRYCPWTIVSCSRHTLLMPPILRMSCSMSVRRQPGAS